MKNKILGMLLILFPALVVIGVALPNTTLTQISVIGLWITNIFTGVQLLKLGESGKSASRR